MIGGRSGGDSQIAWLDFTDVPERQTGTGYKRLEDVRSGADWVMQLIGAGMGWEWMGEVWSGAVPAPHWRREAGVMVLGMPG